MSFFIKELSLINFRNHQDKSFDLSKGINVIVGPNASGKTNCIEALQLLTSGESLRNSSSRHLINFNKDQSMISLYAEDGNRRLDVCMTINTQKKTVVINKNKSNLNQIYTTLPSVLFSPDDLFLIKGSSSVRRNYFDTFGSRLHTQYYEVVSNYKKALYQRNLLLKEVQINKTLLNSWTEYLIEIGSYLFIYRTSLLKKIIPEIQRQFSLITHDMRCDITYIPSLESITTSNDFLYKETDREQYKESLYNSLYNHQQEEINRGQTLYGPHLDDILLLINNNETKHYASQGQQRALSLAIKIAELEVCNNVLHKQPILLLDDVMSELDKERRENLFNVINNHTQAIITTTNLSYFSKEELTTSNIIDIYE